MHHLDNDRPPLTLQVMPIVFNGSLTHHRKNDSALWTILQRLVNLVSLYMASEVGVVGIPVQRALI